MGDASKVEFALGREVSAGHLFKSSFARSFVTSCRDSKSLDYEFLDNGTIAEEAESYDTKNNNFFSLINFVETSTMRNHAANNDASNIWNTEMVQPLTDTSELEKMRKQCQALTEENRRLQKALSRNQTAHVQVIDNVFLQTQLETLQWQLKQTETNRQMYRSLMEQVVRFLDRARKSLDILQEKNTLTEKNCRVPRSRSVHTVHDSSPNRTTASRFTRAKSVTQISPCTTGLREFTWSVLRRNDPVHCTPPRNKQDLNKTHDGVVYRRPKQLEIDPDDVPPEKLSQEAFRLMRTVQSLLSMREPDLVRAMPIEDNSTSSLSPVESSRLQETGTYNGCSSSDRGNESSSTESSDRSCFKSINETDRNLLTIGQNFLPGGRRSLDATSVNSASSKTTEEEDVSNLNISLPDHRFTPTSTPNRRTKVEKKCCKSKPKSKPASVSSVEDESGFSSMSSFQEIGLPAPLISPIKGCHTEVGLPEVPLEKARHRRWSSTSAEFQALFKQHRASSTFTGSQATESLSVWV